MGALDIVFGRGRLLRRRWGGLIDRWKGALLVDSIPGCPIPWKPSVFAPVFYGYRDTTAIFPPVVHPGHAGENVATASVRIGPGELPVFGHPVRIWFPSLDGSPQNAQILEGCGRYPLVILAHGSCPEDEDHYQKWFELPAVLARCGYVVVVPELHLGAPSGNEAEQQLIGKLAAWARSEWEHADSVMPAPATALVGHSWGAGLLGHVAAEASNSYAAYVSLSGVEVPGEMHRSTMPKLFTWGGDVSLEVLGVQISRWQRLTSPAHVAEFQDGGHWDHMPAGRSACDELDGRPQRGSCTLTPFLAADIVGRPRGLPARGVRCAAVGAASARHRPERDRAAPSVARPPDTHHERVSCRAGRGHQAARRAGPCLSVGDPRAVIARSTWRRSTPTLDVSGSVTGTSSGRRLSEM